MKFNSGSPHMEADGLGTSDTSKAPSRGDVYVCPTYEYGKGNIAIEGLLDKRKKMKTWLWKPYWFILQDDQLSYYKDKTRCESRGLIDLGQTHSIRMTAASYHKFSFEIVTHTRSHLLSASSAEIRAAWIKVLKNALLLSVRRSSTMRRPSCNSISDDEIPEDVLEELRNSYMSADIDLDRSNSFSKECSRSSSCDSSCDILRNASCESNDSLSIPTIETTSTTPPNRHVATRRVLSRQPSGQKPLTSKVSYAQDIDEEDNGEEDEVFQNGSGQHCASTTSLLDNMLKYDGVTESHVKSHSTIAYPPLPYPRLELTHRSSFDDIRLFLAANRTCDEVYPIPKASERGGKAIAQLKSFLSKLDKS